MKKLYVLMVALLIILTLTGCTYFLGKNELDKAGMLIEGTVDDNTWDEQGLESLQSIADTYDIETIYKEGMNEKQKITHAVDELAQSGVNLIYGHGNNFGKVFMEIAHRYPDVHFVYFNGAHYAENVTSIHFNSHALGFFAGMVAAKMSETSQIGAMSAYDWQTEVEGFFEGAKYEDPSVDVHIDYINYWDGEDVALKLYDQMKEKQVDVIYPAGDFFSERIIQEATDDQLYAIGFLEDQSFVDERKVLTSTVRDIEKTYALVTNQFNQGELDGGILTFDVEDQLLSLGKFSDNVPKAYQNMLTEEVETYNETGLLPYQR